MLASALAAAPRSRSSIRSPRYSFDPERVLVDGLRQLYVDRHIRRVPVLVERPPRLADHEPVVELLDPTGERLDATVVADGPTMDGPNQLRSGGQQHRQHQLPDVGAVNEVSGRRVAVDKGGLTLERFEQLGRVLRR